jgi:hypoxanthine phosphoribosyltransferase
MTPELHSMLGAWLTGNDESKRRHAEYRLGLPDAVGYVPPTTTATPVVAPHRGRAVAAAIDQWTIVTAEQLTRDTLALAAELPPSIDLIVAVSRSGLMPGGLIASMLHLPLWTVTARHGLADPGHGGRLSDEPWDLKSIAPTPDPRHVLLIDDTAALGREMTACVAIVRERWPESQFTRAVIYCHPGAVGQVDLYHSLYSGSHYLAWNWPNAGHGEACAYDFDGILCRDPTPQECSSQEAYERFIRTATPLYLPRRRPVPLIVSARPESVRGLCMEWLERHGVKCEQLLLRDWQAPLADPGQEDVARFKGAAYAMSGCALFAESSPAQAEWIRNVANKPVLCPAAGRVFPPIERPSARKGGCCG